MNRYFYTDPLAAVWMAKHFGMRITDMPGNEITADYLLGLTGFRTRTFVSVHPDSLKLLEPQDTDTVHFRESIDVNIDSEGMGPFHFLKAEPAYREGRVSVRIVERNGIAFMWPESEEA